MTDTDMTAGQPADPLAELSAERRALLTMELARRRAQADGLVHRPRPGPEPRFPLSYAQERLWFLDQIDPGSTAYLMPGALRLRGLLDRDALHRALNEIIRRHEVLRTTFPAEGGLPLQQINPPRLVAMPVLDLGSQSLAAQEAAVETHHRAEAALPFDLTRDLLLRTRLLRLADDHHVLLLSMHHIASDGWSLGVLVRELTALFDAFRRDAPSPLPELDVQYADYAVWQREWLAQDTSDTQLAYWRQCLADPPVLELPADRPLAGVRTWHGSSVPLGVSAQLRQEMTELATAMGATPYMVLLAAFAVVLFRWSGQSDVVIGVPIAGRRRAELEPLVGFFVNTLPIRVDTAGAPSFDQLLSQVRDRCNAAYAHQDLPFEKIVQAVRPQRSIGSVPLVQAMLALRDVPMDEPALAELEVTPTDPPTSQSSKFDVTFDLVPAPDGGLHGRVEYSTDLFEQVTASRMARAFELVLTAAVRDPARPVDELPVSAGERDWVLDELSGDGRANAADTAGCLHALIDRQAREHPDSSAVSCGDTVLTYRALVTSANRLAHRLRELGVGSEQLVGVCMSKSTDMVVALLGILKAGAGYVPFDPGYPRQRVELMLQDSAVSVVVTEQQVADSGLLGAAGEGPRLVLMDSDARALADQPAEPPSELSGPRTLAYVIYTSGSSGAPKGSANEHGGVTNTLVGLNRVLGLEQSDRMLAISSLNYDMSVYEIFGTLLAGACVVVPGDTETTDPERLRSLLVEAEVTAWSSAPALLEFLVGYVYERGGLAGSVLRLAVLGGDRLPPALADRLSQLLPGLRLYNLAGMTEVSYCSTYHLVREQEPVPGNMPWGRPLPNQRLYVLDGKGEPVPVGVRGELFIGGAGVRRGYWRRPGLTAQRFVPDPFGPDPGGRLYRTGDAARWRVTGELEFLGRLDHQVKLRGFRIEPGEIENSLCTHPQVRESLVLLRADGSDRRLVAYVITQGPLPPSVSELRQHLLDRLPDHMVPSAFVLTDQFPLLPSGKIDRSALPDPPAIRSDLAAEYTDPAELLEQVLAGIWAEVLELDRVGTTDDFFELGGHSLLVTQVVSRIRELFRVQFSIRSFLSAGTITSLVAVLRDEAAAAGMDADRTAELVLQVSAMDEAQVSERLAE